MLQVSEAAGALLVKNLQTSLVPEEAGYRLAASKDSYSLRLDRPSRDDRVMQREGRVLLMVNQSLDSRLDGVILDVHEGDEERLVLEVAGR